MTATVMPPTLMNATKMTEHDCQHIPVTSTIWLSDVKALATVFIYY